MSFIVHIITLFASFALVQENELDFETDVQPILSKHCIDCHGEDESNGGLRLDYRAGAFAETDSGETSIVPGNADESELIRRVTSDDDSMVMPPDQRLSEAEIETLKTWIKQGAVWPTDDSKKRDVRSEHWAFAPIGSPEIPPADDWSDHPIDRFLQQARKSTKLTVADDALPRQVIRRLSYDLTGLPPTMDRVTEFERLWQQSSADAAIAQTTDEMLASREYGERWGRHWMDWVRYADTAGDNSDFPIPQAYLYRNYIIDSLNNDLPYDRFLIEQLAGDLLPADDLEQRNRQLIATGYLAMARRFGSLIETYPWHLTIEDTIDNVGRTMMGMTLSCARCHDHKFDPISTREYYGLYGFFASTRYPFPGIELFKAQNNFPSLLSAQETARHLKQYEDKTTKLQSQLEAQLEQARIKAEGNARKHATASLNEQRKMKGELDSILFKGRKLGEALAAHLKTIPEYPTAYAVSEWKSVDAAIQIKGQPDRPGAVVPRQFPKVLGGQKLDPQSAEQGSGRLQLARWIASKNNPLTARVIVNRVWEKYFGRGIVATSTDFGMRGQSPDHPALLDWLTSDFMEHGWSLKHLHRQIVSSRTWRLSSDPNGKEVAVVDADNVLLTHQNRKRLDAESIRDSILLISGQLNRDPLNQPHPFPKQKDWKYTQHGPFKDTYETNRRSVYMMTKRLTADAYFQTFDGPDRNVCTQSRDQSITALQALYFVNNEFLHQQAENLARQRAGDDDQQRIQWLFQQVLQRNPDEEELGLLVEHLSVARELDDDRAWESVARSLLRLNEFIYVD